VTGGNSEQDGARNVALDQLISSSRYRRLMWIMGFGILAVAVAPLLIMTGVNLNQYRDAFHAELVRPMAQLTSNAKHSLEFFLAERQSALEMVIRDRSFDELADARRLQRRLSNLKHAFGAFIDLELVGSDGQQVSYAGPYHLEGASYVDEGWYHAVNLRDVYVSDVFLGRRQFPHFVIAVRHETEADGSYVLRATIDSEMFNEQILRAFVQPTSDAFIINRDGILQTPSRFFGRVLEKCPLPVPANAGQSLVEELQGPQGEPLIIGSAYVDRSPFIVMFANRAGQQEGWLTLRRELAIFTTASVVLIVVVVFWGSKYMVERLRESDEKRAIIFHNLEYTNKMAAIGRLGAGVAHEINNPLAIIDEKAGLLKDLLTLSDEMPPREKFLKQIDSILGSVERCSAITHRLLGFAKHMDVHKQQIDVELLLKEVLGFLGKEAGYRNIQVDFDIPDDLPNIESDRGQLQQVFLNIINNAFAAVDEGGHVEIAARESSPGRVTVDIKDNGTGISEENLKHVFEPFFTTKKGSGTGLGLSITYGIVEKLGGSISVRSKLNQGTTFSITLPIMKD
jgi:two-component system NtrC family sensor kinase